MSDALPAARRRRNDRISCLNVLVVTNARYLVLQRLVLEASSAVLPRERIEGLLSFARLLFVRFIQLIVGTGGRLVDLSRGHSRKVCVLLRRVGRNHIRKRPVSVILIGRGRGLADSDGVVGEGDSIALLIRDIVTFRIPRLFHPNLLCFVRKWTRLPLVSDHNCFSA